MASEDMLSWLRATVEGDKLLAEAVKDPAEISMGAEYVDNCGSDEAAEHIRRHDTRDTIARCEAELALLDKVDEAGRGLKQALAEEDEMDVALFMAALGALMLAAKALAKGRRHRPGFKPEWVSD